MQNDFVLRRGPSPSASFGGRRRIRQAGDNIKFRSRFSEVQLNLVGSVGKTVQENARKCKRRDNRPTCPESPPITLLGAKDDTTQSRNLKVAVTPSCWALDR
mmetsp:Transcript_42287/g.106664  ORF Transcript_42287/g.106664 Transcript_42287/m.106664 type:complete len:102 (-) Transcript_42287:30-335(-)